ncbi:unnamed protein product [Cylicostephanus goldi]|uniref:Uncharacterized protein n=1 Tax=Cylicostephanus goldi TaxID=71465 RepID=A0A3P6STT4_CYLGO|nr:unnamed protein product [Cylicostephanus goldi]
MQNDRLKQLAVKYEENVNSLHEALEQEHERKTEENNALKAELATAQETSQSLRRDIDKFRQEYNSKEATIRQLREQYETALENNAHMAQIVAELEQVTREKQRPTRKTSEDSVMTLKTRDSQTDMTRTALAQIEFDSVSLSSEVKAFRSAYMELATAIGELVVKDINNLPSPGDLNSIEKSCKELSRFIRHEKRRRDQQAVEIAEVTEKVKNLQTRE